MQAPIGENTDCWQVWFTSLFLVGTEWGGGGDFAYEGGADARRIFWIKPLKETMLKHRQMKKKKDF